MKMATNKIQLVSDGCHIKQLKIVFVNWHIRKSQVVGKLPLKRNYCNFMLVSDGCHIKQVRTIVSSMSISDTVSDGCHIKQVRTSSLDVQLPKVVPDGCHFKQCLCHPAY